MARKEIPGPAWDENQVLVRTTRSVVSAGTERMILDLAKKSLLGKALSRPDLVRQFLAKMKREGMAAAFGKAMAKLDTPVPVGYSAAGVVLETGSAVEGLREGMLVACGGARYANHADLIAVPRRLCVPVPTGVTDEDAAFTTVGAIAMQGVRQLSPDVGEVHVVLGLGLIGMLTAQILQASGCRVLGFDPDPHKRNMAAGLQVETCTAEALEQRTLAATQGHGADGVVLAASTRSNDPIETAARLCRSKGRVVILGMVGLEVPRQPFYEKELELKLSMSYGPGRYDPVYEEKGVDYPYGHVRWTEQRNMSAFLDLVAQEKVRPAGLVTHRFPFEQALDAYQLLESGAGYVGIVLEYGDSPDRARTMRRLTPFQPVPGKPMVALVGAGSFARAVLMPRLRRLGVPVLGVATASAVTAEHAADRLGAELVSTDYRELVADDRVDAVFVLTRHDQHAQQVIFALERGKHVFCEKPLAINEEQLAALAETAAASTGQLMVGFNRRFSSHAARVRAHFADRGPLHMVYRINAGEIPPGSWLQDTTRGGGRIVGEACHFIDLMSFVTGAPPLSVRAHAARHGREDLPDRDDMTAVIEFGDGSIGTLHYLAGGSAALPKEYLEVHAGGRSAVCNDFRRTTLGDGARKRRFRTRGQDKGFDAELRAFLGSLQEGEPAIALDSLLATTRATFAIETSLRTGETVALA